MGCKYIALTLAIELFFFLNLSCILSGAESDYIPKLPFLFSELPALGVPVFGERSPEERWKLQDTFLGMRVCNHLHGCPAWQTAAGRNKVTPWTTIRTVMPRLWADNLCFSDPTRHSSSLRSALYSVIFEFLKSFEYTETIKIYYLLY